jgi:hypothetical protein
VQNSVQPGGNIVSYVGQIVALSFVFMHIPGGSVIFNIVMFMGGWYSPAGLFPLPLDA